jgi:hypothetical protein
MIFLVSPDSRGRMNLARFAVKDESYAVAVDGDGVITLTPSVVVPRSDLDELISIRPVLAPDEAFGQRGAVEAAQAVQDNSKSRRAGGRPVRISTVGALHDLIWGDAA